MQYTLNLLIDGNPEMYWWMAELEQPTVIRRIHLYLNDIAVAAGKLFYGLNMIIKINAYTGMNIFTTSR